MHTTLSFTKQQYDCVRTRLFRGKKEQGCFLFVTSHINGTLIELNVKDFHLIAVSGWSYQSGFHLELDEKEKIKIMIKARQQNCDVIECHSHRFSGSATFSPSDIHGLNEFVRYIWWKLPDKIYGAIVFTKSDAQGQIWLPKQRLPLPLNEICALDANGKRMLIGKSRDKNFRKYL